MWRSLLDGDPYWTHGDIQMIPQHIPPDVFANLEINCHGHAPMYRTSCDMFDTGLMDIFEGYIEYE